MTTKKDTTKKTPATKKPADKKNTTPKDPGHAFKTILDEKNRDSICLEIDGVEAWFKRKGIKIKGSKVTMTKWLYDLKIGKFKNSK